MYVSIGLLSWTRLLIACTVASLAMCVQVLLEACLWKLEACLWHTTGNTSEWHAPIWICTCTALGKCIHCTCMFISYCVTWKLNNGSKQCGPISLSNFFVPSLSSQTSLPPLPHAYISFPLFSSHLLLHSVPIALQRSTHNEVLGSSKYWYVPVCIG